VPVENGIQTAGTNGRGTHHGEPLTCEQIRQLPDGAEVVVTWCGGNGPSPVRVLVDTEGQRRAEGLYCDRFLDMDGSPSLPGGLQQVPLHRITLGWDEPTRAWFEQMRRIPYPDHIIERQELLRGVPQPAWTDGQLRVAAALEDAGERLVNLKWTTWSNPSTIVKREDLFAAVNEAAKTAFGNARVPAPYPGGPTYRWAVMLTPQGRAAAGADDQDVARALLDLSHRLASLVYTTPGGVPSVDRDLIFKPVDQAAEQALGTHWARAMRKARRREH
jgi:hypothetical protein